MANPKRFNRIENILYDNMVDGGTKKLKNIFNRVSIVDTFAEDPTAYYEYIVKDGETPEILADLYYDDTRYYWVILEVNKITSVYDEWPLASHEFQRMIQKRYGSVQDAYNDIRYYVHKENGTKVNVETYNKNKITSDNYKNSYTPFSSYDYEEEKNEKNRVIKLIRKSILKDFIDEYDNALKL